jgi:hypothetical protein
MNVLITHDHTSGGKPCGVAAPMELEKLNFIVAWLQGELNNIAMGTPLIEDDCVDLLCKFYECTKIEEGWDEELNLCDNWNEYLCGNLWEDRKPFVDQCKKEEALTALRDLAVEMEKCRV